LPNDETINLLLFWKNRKLTKAKDKSKKIKIERIEGYCSIYPSHLQVKTVYCQQINIVEIKNTALHALCSALVSLAYFA
jgi:hypothetical protein